MMRRVGVVFSAAAVLLVSGCASTMSANDYGRSAAMQEMEVKLATVLSVRPVRIEAPEHAGGAGGATGASLGAIAGSNVGSGRGSLAGAIAGALIGGVIGVVADKAANTREGIEIVYRLDDTGETKALVQGRDESAEIKPGDRVRIMKMGSRVRAVKL